MDLNKITIKLKTRQGYGAIDLGARMAQRNWKLMFLSFVTFSLPFYIGLFLLFPDSPLWCAFAIWVLKPIFERPLLLILSHDVFDQKLSYKDVLKQSKKVLFKQFFIAISWRRFSPTRSFDAPISQLENLSGAERKKRLSALHSRSPASISSLTIMLHLVEFLLTIGFTIFIFQFLPKKDIDFLLFMEQLLENTGLNLYYVTLSICWFISMCLVAPFYVAGGFSSYLNQRSLREAWDIELTFRQLSAKHHKKRFDYKNLTACIIVSLCLVTSSWSLPSVAKTPNTAQSNTQTALNEGVTEKTAIESKYDAQKNAIKKEIEKIQEGPEYKRTVTEVVIKPLFDSDQNTVENKPNKNNSDALGFGKLLSWIFLGVVIAYILYKLPAIIEYFSSGIKNHNERLDKSKAPEQLFGLDLNKDSLPDDIIHDAQALWKNGQARQALGLIYRASLSDLIFEKHCPFEDGFTELECLNIVESMNLTCSAYFSKLTASWRNLAYGHKVPSQENFDELCLQWSENFDNHVGDNEQNHPNLVETVERGNTHE